MLKMSKNRLRNITLSKTVKNGLWLMILQGFNTVIPLLTLPYITRILSTSSYGQFTVALNVIGYLQIVVEYGFGLTGSRAIAIDKTQATVNKYFRGILSSRLMLLVLAATALTIFCIFAELNTSQLICLVILFMMVIATVFQQTWLFHGMQDMKYITIINVISRTISVGLIFALVKDPDDLYLYCFLYTFSFLISCVVGAVIAIKKYHIILRFSALKEIASFVKEGWYIFLSSGITKIVSGFGVSILALYATDSIVGIYGAIYKIPTVLQLAYSPISQAVYPTVCALFSQSYQDGITKVKKTFAIVFLPFFLGGVLLMVFRSPLVHLLFGQEYTKYANVLIMLILWILFGFINNFLGVQILVASGNQERYSQLFSISMIVFVLLNLVLGKKYGIYGISFAALWSEVILCLLLLWAVVIDKKRYTNENQQE